MSKKRTPVYVELSQFTTTNTNSRSSHLPVDMGRLMNRLAQLPPPPLAVETKAPSPEAAGPVLTNVDREVLKALAEKYPDPVLQLDLVEATRRSRKTLGAVLKKLRGLGLAERPCGDKKGDALTAAGLRAAQRK